jgi:tyrosyl-tRNA synthetase
MDMTSKEAEIDELLSRGVGNFFDPEGKFKEKLLKKAEGKYEKDILVKFGIDPTRPDIHLGHAVVLRKLRKLQDLGCKVVFLVGDFTAQIGDPTGKDKIRPEIEQKEVEKNVETYIHQIDKILNVQRDFSTKTIKDSPIFSWIRNSMWFLGVTDVLFEKESIELPLKQLNVSNPLLKNLKITVPSGSFLGKAVYFQQNNMQSRFLKKPETHVITVWHLLRYLRGVTHNELIDRDMFQTRIQAEKPLHMHELLYPILQGIDSSLLAKIYGSCDLEIGGTDQTFNMLMGRKIMEIDKHKEPQAVLSVEILEGTDGVQKMSKSLDNYISITEEPENMFGKVMSLKDDLIIKYFVLCTYTPREVISRYEKEIEEGKNPKDYKMKLAHEIVAIYHGEEKAKKAEEYFIKAFSKKEIPENIKTIEVEKGTFLADVLKKEGGVSSGSEFGRKLEEGAIRFVSSEGEEKIIKNQKEILSEDGTVRLGKFLLGIKIKTP